MPLISSGRTGLGHNNFETATLCLPADATYVVRANCNFPGNFENATFEQMIPAKPQPVVLTILLVSSETPSSHDMQEQFV